MLFIFGLVFIGAVLTLALLNYPSYKRRKECLNKIPSPKGLPFGIGHALEIRSTIEFYEKFKKWTEELGNLFKINFGPLKTIYVTSDPGLFELILSQRTALTKKAKLYYLMSPWLGNGLLMATGKKWQMHKKVIQPIFHIKILEQFIDTFDKHTSTLIKLLDKEENKDCVEISRYTNLLALDVVCETIIGVDINSQENKDSAYVKAIHFLVQNAMNRAFSLMGQNNLTYSFTKACEEERKQLKVLNEFIDSIIKQRKEELFKEGLNANKRHYQTLLDMLLLESTFTNEEIKGEVNTFVHGGHDTSGVTLSFALYCLSNHPFVQQKAYEEVCSILDFNQQCTISDLNKMKYLEKVIKETLRIYTIGPILAREIVEEFQYKENTFFKGNDIILYLQGAHWDPNNFVNPHKFDPERWNDDHDKEKEDKTHSFYSFIPFSAGQKKCIGQKYAMLELKCVLAKILLHFELLPSNPEIKPILAIETTLKTTNGLYIGLKKRIIQERVQFHLGS